MVEKFKKKIPPNKYAYKFKSERNKSQVRYGIPSLSEVLPKGKHVDIDKISAPVVKMTLIQFVLSIVASMNLELEIMQRTSLLGSILNKISTRNKQKDLRERVRKE